jgi:hypothetical protein
MGLGGGPLGAIIGRYPSAAAGEDELGGGGGGGGGGAAGAGIISHNRRCRDVTFLVAFAAFWVAMIVNSSFGFNQGNPLRSDSPARPPAPPLPPPVLPGSLVPRGASRCRKKNFFFDEKQMKRHARRREDQTKIKNLAFLITPTEQ